LQSVSIPVFASQISTHPQTIARVPNSIHSWLNLAPSLPFCVSLIWAIWNAFFCDSGGKGYPATENLIGQFPIIPNAQKNKLQSRWQEFFFPGEVGVVYPKSQRPLKSIFLHMANHNGKCCNISGYWQIIMETVQYLRDEIYSSWWDLTRPLWVGISFLSMEHVWGFWLSPWDKLDLSTLPFLVERIHIEGLSSSIFYMDPIH